MAGLTPCYTYGGFVIKDSRDTNATACDQTVCNWSANGYRLPSEGEWQFTASNKGATPWNYGSGGIGAYTGINATDFPLFDPIAWYGNSTTSPDGNTTTTKDVGTKTANALVLFDMSGNVWEWCWDWYGAYPGVSTDYRGSASGSYRVVRGGCWGSDALSLRVGLRNLINPGYEGSFIGFRVARTN